MNKISRQTFLSLLTWAKIISIIDLHFIGFVNILRISNIDIQMKRSLSLPQMDFKYEVFSI